MKDKDEIKEIVKDKYGQIARQSSSSCGPASCCATADNKIVGYSVMQDDYTKLDGYVADADLGLGCGLPTEYAGIRKGDVVVDLGSGAGNDAFVARAIIGEHGRVIGIDMTQEMIDKANRNNQRLGYTNVEFLFGEIENLPLDNETADVVVSNCVLNLVPDKQKAFAEIHRILKTGGHFCISDIVINGELPANLKRSAEMYSGCVAGAIQDHEYLDIISGVGFKHVEIKKTKAIDLPDDVLREYLTETAIVQFRQSRVSIYSITVTADKN
ncbi:MAG: arsenite methyltransferase [Nitrospirae bacterium]|nr:arsenite methyltransferase [Nitrospirota bacterium]